MVIDHNQPIGIQSQIQSARGTYVTMNVNITALCAQNFEGSDCTQCIPGFTGANCDVNIDNCVGVNCSGNKICVDGINGFTCECMNGYNGLLCNQCKYNIEHLITVKSIWFPDHCLDLCTLKIIMQNSY